MDCGKSSRRTRRLLLGLTLVLAAGGAAAQQVKPQYSTSDIVKSFAKPADPCAAQGMVAVDGGDCEPTKDPRGFSLPTRAGSGPQAGGARTTARRPARQMAANNPAATAHRDLLITFRLGSAELSAQAKANAEVFAQALNTPQLANMAFEINGHTDATGVADKNRILSQQRADAVKAFLVSQGVAATRLEAKGFGSDQLAIPSQPFSAANRRVEARRLP